MGGIKCSSARLKGANCMDLLPACHLRISVAFCAVYFFSLDVSGVHVNVFGGCGGVDVCVVAERKMNEFPDSGWVGVFWVFLFFVIVILFYFVGGGWVAERGRKLVDFFHF